MPQQTKREKTKNAKTFAKAIAEGCNQSEAYRKTFPKAKESTVYSHSSRYAKRPEVIEKVNQALSRITHEDAKMVVNRVVQTAKKSGGDIDRNRELFFKLAGHPSFTKQTNISVNTGNVPVDVVEKIGSMLDRLDAVANKLDVGMGKQAEFIDAEYWPSSTENNDSPPQSSTTNLQNGNLSTENAPSLDDKQTQ